MKKAINILLIIIVALWVIGKVSNRPRSSYNSTYQPYTPSAQTNEPATSGNLKDIMSKEPKVLDYVLTDANVLYASVSDDGTNRNGYAQYLYYEVKGAGIKIYKAVVVKVGSQKDPNRDNAYGVKLGEYKE